MFSIFKRPKPIQDALIDIRPYEERQKNWLDIEFAMGSDEPDYNIQPKEYFPYNQWTSLSCVSLAPVVWLEEFNKTISSRKDIYIRRFNKPNGGMAMHDKIKIVTEGAALESQVASQGLGEVAMNTPYTVTQEILNTRANNKIKGAVYIKNRNNIDDIVKSLKHSPVSIFLAFDTSLQNQEYWTPRPNVINKNLNIYAPTTSRHGVVAIGSKIENGIKYLIIQDSAGVGTGYGINRNLRDLSEDFVKSRVYEAAYSIPAIDIKPPVKKLKWTGKRNLQVGTVGDDVKRLQEILQAEGCFDFPNPTGFFGGATRSGVIKLQNKYAKEILQPVGLRFGTGIVGQATRSWLTKNYS